jgi:hypothetical protein
MHALQGNICAMTYRSLKWLYARITVDYIQEVSVTIQFTTALYRLPFSLQRPYIPMPVECINRNIQVDKYIVKYFFLRKNLSKGYRLKELNKKGGRNKQLPKYSQPRKKLHTWCLSLYII